MDDNAPGRVRRLPKLALALGVTLIIGIGVASLWRSRAAAWAGADGKAQRISVVPFREDPSASGWPAEAFAESIAVRLRATPGLDARVDRGSVEQVDYVLEGDVTADSDGIAIALRLRPAGQRAATWSATFWRHDLADTTLAGDLALAVAEALHATGRQGNATGTPLR